MKKYFYIYLNQNNITMKRKIFLFLSFTLFALMMNAQETITIKKIPATIDEYVEMRNQIATTPEGGAAMFLLALKMYIDNPDLAKQCFVTIVDRNSLREGNVYKGYQLLNGDMDLIKRQMANDKYIPNSYIKGSKPENNYSVKLPYIYVFSSNRYSGDKAAGQFKVFAACSGASSPRPMSLKRNNRGIWKLTNWSSVLVGIAKPPIDDDL